MSIPSALATLTLVVALPLNWYVAAKLWRLSRRSPATTVLRERAIVASALAIIVTVFALVFWNNDVPAPILNGEATKVITRVVVFLGSLIPALYWLWLYRGAKP